MQKVLIAGASRGIGFEMARLFAERGDDVTITCRRPPPDGERLPVRCIEDVDVTDDSAVAKLADALAGSTLDVLVHNAGILSRETLDDLDFDRIREQFEVNALAPLRVVSALRQNLAPGSKVGIVTSRMGSIEDNGSGGMYGYRISKAAANMVGKTLSRDLADSGVAVVLLHPGLVATRMTGGNGIDPADAARGLIEQIDALSMESSGGFRHAEGYTLPW